MLSKKMFKRVFHILADFPWKVGLPLNLLVSSGWDHLASFEPTFFLWNGIGFLQLERIFGI